MLNGVEAGDFDSSLDAGSDVPHINLPHVWRQPGDCVAGGDRDNAGQPRHNPALASNWGGVFGPEIHRAIALG